MNVLLAVSGSISCYKAYDLARALVRRNHCVKMILTKGALNFIKPQTFRYLGVKAVYTHDDDFCYPRQEADAPVLHVSLARWADKLIVAPLSANTASRLARGEASDLLTSLFLSLDSRKPILVFPAMNTKMLSHPFTRENLASLEKIKSLSQVFVHPGHSGLLACGDEGNGKLPEIEEIVALSETITNVKSNKKALIVTGATLSLIDPVRYVTNPSSGITGYYLACESLNVGHRVICIAGRYATRRLDLLENHPYFQLARVTTTEEMYRCVDSEFDDCDLYISPAAIGDLEYDMHKEKIKKDSFDHQITFKKSIDILTNMIKRKKHQLIIGFAGETDLSIENLMEKHRRKPVDLLVGTRVFHDAQLTTGFQEDQADYKFFNGQTSWEGRMGKEKLAHYILEWAQDIKEKGKKPKN